VRTSCICVSLRSSVGLGEINLRQIGDLLVLGDAVLVVGKGVHVVGVDSITALCLGFLHSRTHDGFDVLATGCVTNVEPEFIPAIHFVGFIIAPSGRVGFDALAAVAIGVEFLPIRPAVVSGLSGSCVSYHSYLSGSKLPAER
jgi:hypothetical protein